MVRAGDVDEPVGRAARPSAAGCSSWSRLLGLLSGADRAPRPPARAPPGPTSQSRTASSPRSRKSGAGDGLEGRGQQGRTAAGRRAAPRPRRGGGTRRGRSGRPAGPARRCRRWRRGAPTGTPSSSSGWRRVERLGDGEVDDGVTEELEALVVADGARRGARGARLVDERLLEQVEVADREPESLREGLARVARRSPSGRGRVVRARTRARRCSRRRPGRCGSSPRPRPRSPSRTPPRGS